MINLGLSNALKNRVIMKKIADRIGSILGPFHYLVYVSPLFDLVLFQAFADENQVTEINVNI